MPGGMIELLARWQGQFGWNHRINIWKVMCHCLMWSIWRERNGRCFWRVWTFSVRPENFIPQIFIWVDGFREILFLQFNWDASSLFFSLLVAVFISFIHPGYMGCYVLYSELYFINQNGCQVFFFLIDQNVC